MKEGSEFNNFGTPIQAYVNSRTIRVSGSSLSIVPVVRSAPISTLPSQLQLPRKAYNTFAIPPSALSPNGPERFNPHTRRHPFSRLSDNRLYLPGNASAHAALPRSTATPRAAALPIQP